MKVTLNEHPEWEGDWQMRAGIEQVEIDPKTGELATADTLEKRTELFINGTGPNHIESAAVEEATPAEEVPEPEARPVNPGEGEITPSPSPSPSPPAHAKPSPEGARLEGTITLDIDPTTRLIAVETCPVVRTKTFVLGTEPKKYCGPQYHKARVSDPSESRPREVGTPPSATIIYRLVILDVCRNSKQ